MISPGLPSICRNWFLSSNVERSPLVEHLKEWKKSVLAMVIDDSRTIRLIIGDILRELGFSVLEARNGLEALESLKRNPDVELMLIDWNMPEMNGFELLRAVRVDKAYDTVRILMVTTESQAEKVSQALNAGANEYLMKPFDKEILVAKLNLMDVLQE